MSGLRTLVFSYRELDSNTYESLLKKFTAAQCQIGPERARAVDDIAAKIECDMTLIGVSGVEDKLQPGVKRCLQSLISAGIQVGGFTEISFLNVPLLVTAYASAGVGVNR